MQQLRDGFGDGCSCRALGHFACRTLASFLASSFGHDATCSTFNTEPAANSTKAGAQQNLVQVLAAVFLRLNSGLLSLGFINAGLNEGVLGFFVDSAFDGAGTHAGANAHASSLQAQSASAQHLGAQDTQNGRGSSAKALRQQVNRGDGERLEASLNLIQHALVFCILENASDLFLVVLRLSGHQAGQVAFSALEGLGRTTASAKRIGNHPHASHGATAKTQGNVSYLTQKALIFWLPPKSLIQRELGCCFRARSERLFQRKLFCHLQLLLDGHESSSCPFCRTFGCLVHSANHKIFCRRIFW